MITLYAFGNVHPMVHGETRDLRVQWALEETGLPYAVKGIDHTGGENLGPAFSDISPFNQIPILDDDGFVLSESAAIVLYLAEKSGKLIPGDFQGRTRVNQWAFGALSTVEIPLAILGLIALGGIPDAASTKEFLTGYANRVLDGVERHLANDGEPREWIACADFTAADLLLACVLRHVRKTDLLEPYPRLRDFYARAMARPAWRRTLDLYAERLGADREKIV